MGKDTKNVRVTHADLLQQSCHGVGEVCSDQAVDSQTICITIANADWTDF